MKVEILKSRNFRKLTLGIGALAILGCGIVIGASKAKYQQVQDMRLVNGSISYKLADMSVVAMYQETSSGSYEEINEIPSGGGVFFKQ